jgi:predicted nucleic acid-binding protein
MDTLTVLDTDVFIDHFRGLAAATAYIQRLLVTQRATIDVTVMELYKGALNREQLTTIARFLERNHVRRLPVSAAAAQRAVTLLHDYGLAHGLGIPDTLIAAIALEGDHTLVTSNLPHFRFIAG